MSFKGLFDDRRDNISLPSLGQSLERNRVFLENLSKSIRKDNPEMSSLREYYGNNWYKCSKLSCYYFHEGFQSQAIRQKHFDRHDRPFSCDDEDCVAGRIGFPSLKELEKHKRNMHPGIDKLSSTFARFKKGKNGKTTLSQYPCSLCSENFDSRLECRIHMAAHYGRILPKPTKFSL
jgi:hypothetical protein